jgi:hypothetical protein
LLSTDAEIDVPVTLTVIGAASARRREAPETPTTVPETMAPELRGDGDGTAADVALDGEVGDAGE